MNRTLLLIGIGGFLGGIARYAITSCINRLLPSVFPWGTIVVNLIGCFMIGVFFGLSNRYSWVTPEWRIFLTTGLCGGFTTFSAFAYENFRILEAGNYSVFTMYCIASVGLGLMAVFLGILVTKF